MGMRFRKREKGGRRLSGSLSVEAALSLSLFFFFMVLLTVPMELLSTQRKIQMVLETRAREISGQAWLAEREEPRWESGAVILALQAEIKKAAGEGKVEALDCTGSRIFTADGMVDLRARYRLTLPVSVFSLSSIPFSARSRKRGWIGREGGSCFGSAEEEKKETMVFVGRDSSRYHLSAQCHYLSNQLTAVLLEEAEEKKNLSGSHYRPCRVCGAGAKSGGVVYLFSSGEVYHSRQDCPAVGFYIRRVPLSEVEALGACSYCGGGK